MEENEKSRLKKDEQITEKERERGRRREREGAIFCMTKL